MLGKKDFTALMEKHGQTHVIQYLDSLSDEKAETFLRSASLLNYKLVFRLFREETTGAAANDKKRHAGIEPPLVFKPGSEREKRDLAVEGEKLISGGKTAVMVVAGGQATRLGCNYPKGFYPVSPVKGKPLFMLFGEKVRALSLKYGVKIPFLIMTSPGNHEEIRGFFEKKGFFGLDRSTVFFFKQELLPSLTPEGLLILRGGGEIMSNPDGHGGSLKALHQSGLLDEIEKRGIENMFYCHVDNPLVRVLDPLFLAHHVKSGADFSLKVVKKLPDEKVGTFVIAGGRPAVIEYIELPEPLRTAVDPKGRQLFNSGSIGIHVINTEFISSLNRKGVSLPYHRQRKKIALPGGREKEIWKFETFIFDAIPLAGRVSCMETERDEEFAPLKNRTGRDSPADVKQKMANLYRSWLDGAGIKVASGATVEVSPLFALSREEFIQKIKGCKKEITENTYIE